MQYFHRDQCLFKHLKNARCVVLGKCFDENLILTGGLVTS